MIKVKFPSTLQTFPSQSFTIDTSAAVLLQKAWALLRICPYDTSVLQSVYRNQLHEEKKLFMFAKTTIGMILLTTNEFFPSSNNEISDAVCHPSSGHTKYCLTRRKPVLST
jgi:hypothetical protein